MKDLADERYRLNYDQTFRKKQPSHGPRPPYSKKWPPLAKVRAPSSGPEIVYKRDTRYIHVRGELRGKEVGMTICYILKNAGPNNGIAPQGNVSFCAPGDTFCRRTGREVAMERCRTQVANLFSPDPHRSFVEYLCDGDFPGSPSWVARATWSIR